MEKIFENDENNSLNDSSTRKLRSSQSYYLTQFKALQKKVEHQLNEARKKKLSLTPEQWDLLDREINEIGNNIVKEVELHKIAPDVSLDSSLRLPENKPSAAALEKCRELTIQVLREKFKQTGKGGALRKRRARRTRHKCRIHGKDSHRRKRTYRH
jgi:hypothetical protein